MLWTNNKFVSSRCRLCVQQDGGGGTAFADICRITAFLEMKEFVSSIRQYTHLPKSSKSTDLVRTGALLTALYFLRQFFRFPTFFKGRGRMGNNGEGGRRRETVEEDAGKERNRGSLYIGQGRGRHRRWYKKSGPPMLRGLGTKRGEEGRD